MLDQTDGGDFCDVLWVRFRSVDEAKSAKKRWDDSPFYAHPLHITYAPEYASPQHHAVLRYNLLLSHYHFCASRSLSCGSLADDLHVIDRRLPCQTVGTNQISFFLCRSVLRACILIRAQVRDRGRDVGEASETADGDLCAPR